MGNTISILITARTDLVEINFFVVKHMQKSHDELANWCYEETAEINVEIFYANVLLSHYKFFYDLYY